MRLVLIRNMKNKGAIKSLVKEVVFGNRYAIEINGISVLSNNWPTNHVTVITPTNGTYVSSYIPKTNSTVDMLTELIHNNK